MVVGAYRIALRVQWDDGVLVGVLCSQGLGESICEL